MVGTAAVRLLQWTGVFGPSQQPIDSGVRHLGDEVLIDQDIARLEVPVDQRRCDAVQIVQTCNSEFKVQTLCLFYTFELSIAYIRQRHDLAVLIPLAAPMAIESLCLNSNLVIDSLPVSDE